MTTNTAHIGGFRFRGSGLLHSKAKGHGFESRVGERFPTYRYLILWNELRQLLFVMTFFSITVAGCKTAYVGLFKNSVRETIFSVEQVKMM